MVMLRIVPGLLATLVFAQAPAEPTAGRVLHFTRPVAARDFQQIVIAIRGITDLDVPQISIDSQSGSLSVRGTAAQIAVAEWLVQQLDAQSPLNAAPLEYQIPSTAYPAIRVLRITNVVNPRDQQEILVAIRGIFDCNRLFVVSAAKSIVLRGTAEQARAAAWLLENVDRPAGGSFPAPEFRLFDTSDPGVRMAPAVRVFPLTNGSPRDQVDLAEGIRAIAEIGRIFVCLTPRILVARGSPEELTLVAWLLGKLDKPAAAQDGSAHEYPIASTGDVARLFFPARGATPETRQDLVAKIRDATGIRHIFIFEAAKALGLRGTVNQVALAARLFEEKNAPAVH
jgi:hypothetical protein